jgi:cullin 1
LLSNDGINKFTEKSVVYLNKKFYNKSKKISLYSKVQQNYYSNNINHIYDEIENDRKIILQATVVRILKFRKFIEKNNLVNEIIVQLKSKFFPSIFEINDCLSELIDKDYLNIDNGVIYYN